MNKLNWGLIGCGDIARKRVTPALRELANSELIAVSRAQANLAAAFAQEFGARRWYADWRELLADDEIHAVYLATPVHLHAEQTIAAAEAGKHVLCEKPMALSVAECDRMLAACQTHGVQLGIAYYRHSYQVLHRIKTLLADGVIGRPVVAQINAFERFNPAPDHPRHWFVKKELAGGGPMMDFGCHRIEVLLNLLGPIASVQSSVGQILFQREVEDTAVALFEFANGARGTLTVTHAALESQDTLSLFGSEGSLHLPSLNQGSLVVRTAAGEHTEEIPPHANLHQPFIDEFTEAILRGSTPAVTGATGREVQRLIELIYQ
ncbi:MAG: Gfo/Idh/MocA family oxidoreductase [Acidobacteria bacterium]|nr:Gfo/Idh/MocA family oxidoreductase [Acidobacteriota bacterium]